MLKRFFYGAAGLVATIAVAYAAAGPANFAGIWNGGLHGAPQAIMGCDGSSPNDCAMGVMPTDKNGAANDATHPTWVKAGAAADVCQDPNIAKSSAVINIGAATTTKIVDVSGSKAIYVCGYTMSLAGTTPSITFKSGTNVSTDCDTGAASLSGTILPSTGSMVSFTGQGTVLQTVAAKQLCGTTAGTSSSAQGILQYVQQ